MSDDIKIEQGPPPKMRVKAGAVRSRSMAAIEQAKGLAPGTWFRVPGTSNGKLRGSGIVASRIANGLKKAGLAGIAVGIAEDDGSVIVRRMSKEALHASIGRRSPGEMEQAERARATRVDTKA